VLVISQLGKLLGLSISATDPIPQLEEVVDEFGVEALDGPKVEPRGTAGK
jgi:hypothetical protein